MLLQAAQDERRTFVSSLMPLLEEYSLQPSIIDAQSIVSSLKVAFSFVILNSSLCRHSSYLIITFIRPFHPLSLYISFLQILFKHLQERLFTTEVCILSWGVLVWLYYFSLVVNGSIKFDIYHIFLVDVIIAAWVVWKLFIIFKFPFVL